MRAVRIDRWRGVAWLAATAVVAVAAPAAAEVIADDWLVRFAAPAIPDNLDRELERLTARTGVVVRREAVRMAATVRLKFATAVPETWLRGALEALWRLDVVEPNRRYRPVRLPDEPRLEEQWGLRNAGQTIEDVPPDPADCEDSECLLSDRDTGTAGYDINAAAAWEITIGSRDVRVAIVDTGIDRGHPALAANMGGNSGDIADNGLDDDGNGFVDDASGWDACDEDGIPDDMIGHGTEVAGVIGARGDDGQGLVGVAWQVTLLAAKSLGTSPTPDDSDCNLTSAAIDALEWARSVGADVVNMSWGGEEDSQLLEDKLRELAAAGIVLIAAAGNDGVDLDSRPFYPASYEIGGLIAVGAHTNDGRPASFSNHGRVVRLAAPGTSILAPSPAREDGWDGRNFDAASIGALGTGPIAGTDFAVDGAAPFGLGELTTGDVAVIGDYAAAVDDRGHGADIDATLTSDAMAAAAFGSAVLRYTLAWDLGDDARVRLEWSDGGAFATVPGASYSGSGAVEEYVDVGAVAGGLPAALRVRFHFTTADAHEGELPGGFYLFDVAWLRAGVADGDGDYSYTQGTSLAAPYVAGAAALVRAAAPELDPAAVAAQLVERSALLAVADSGVAGDRRLDAAAALNFEPALAWMGGTGFTADGVEPDVPRPGELVRFRARLVDPEDDVGAISSAELELVDPRGTPTRLPLEFSADGTFAADTTLPSAGGWTYRFAVVTAGGELGGTPADAQLLTVAGDPPAGSGGGGGPVPGAAEGGGGCGCALAPHGARPDAAWLLLALLPWWRRRSRR